MTGIHIPLLGSISSDLLVK